MTQQFVVREYPYIRVRWESETPNLMYVSDKYGPWSVHEILTSAAANIEGGWWVPDVLSVEEGL